MDGDASPGADMISSSRVTGVEAPDFHAVDVLTWFESVDSG